MNEQIILALIAVIGGVLGGVVTGLFTRRSVIAQSIKDEAEAKEIEDRITERCLERAEQEQIKLSKRIKVLEIGIAARDLRISELERQVAEIPTLKAEIAQLHKENADLRIKYNQAQNENRKLTNRIRELEKKAGTGPLKER